MSENKVKDTKVKAPEAVENSVGNAPKTATEAVADLINAETENAKSGKLSLNYVLSQIEKLQSKLADLRDVLFPIQCVNDQQGCTEEGEPLDYMPEVALQKIAAAKEIISEREKTLNSMLDFYKKLYDDLNDVDAVKIDLIKNAFSEHTEKIKSSDLPSEDKHAELSDITEKIAELTQKLLIPSATPTTKQILIAELTRTLRAQGVSAEDKDRAKEILKSYVETPF